MKEFVDSPLFRNVLAASLATTGALCGAAVGLAFNKIINVPMPVEK